MTWQWDASPSPGILAYVLTLALMRRTGEFQACDPDTGDCWLNPTYEVTATVDFDSTPGLSLPDYVPNPDIGECWMIDIEAQDAAGNRSSGE